MFPPEDLQCQTHAVSETQRTAVIPITPCHIDLSTGDHTGLCVKDRGVTEASAESCSEKVSGRRSAHAGIVILDFRRFLTCRQTFYSRGEELLRGLQELHVALDWGFVYFSRLSLCLTIQNNSVTVLWSSDVLSRLAEKCTYTCTLIVAARFDVTPQKLLIIGLNIFWGCLGDYWPQTAKFRSIKIRKPPLFEMPHSLPMILFYPLCFYVRQAGLFSANSRYSPSVFSCKPYVFFGQTDHFVQKFQRVKDLPVLDHKNLHPNFRHMELNCADF